MRLRDVVRGQKDDISVGSWKTGRVSQSAFPMTKAPSKAYKFGPTYCWCVIKFRVGVVDCRILVVYNHQRARFRATLGVMEPDGLRLMCDHEYHPAEPWHCHFYGGESADVPTGQRRTYMRRWPKRRGVANAPFPNSEIEALRKVLQFYRVETSGTLL